MLQNNYELLFKLKNMGYLKSERDPLWWPDSGTEYVIFGALLTQQTKWENVERSLENLRSAGLNRLETLADSDSQTIASLIKPSGFYNTKAQRLQAICRNILETFGTFARFQEEVEREWLLDQKGIGMESADSILCYGCKRSTFVVDSYTRRILEALGRHFGSYTEIQAWMVEGVENHLDEIDLLYGMKLPRYQIYARFHGKIVEFAKENIRGNRVNLDGFK